MSKKIFWSWQDDYAPEANRYFVRDALSIAIEGLNEELEIEDADRLDLDEAMKDKVGAPEMAQAILKKILQAAVFVADLTPIAELPPRPDKGKKKRKALPNPNVLFELGYALKALGEEKIIMILNKVSGFEPEELPFDIKNRYVLMYEYEEDTGEATKKEAAEKLSGKLKEDLERCLKHHEESTASEQEIRGVKAMEGDPSIWATLADPLSYQSNSRVGVKEVCFPQGAPRGYLRIIPAGWKNGIPHSRDIKNQTIETNVYAFASNDFGRCEEGFVDLRIREGVEKIENGEPVAENVAMWFKETGEYWFIHGTAFSLTKEKGPLCLSLKDLIKGWDQALRAVMKAFDNRNAEPKRRVEAGLVGIKGVHLRSMEFSSRCPPFKNAISLPPRQLDNWDDEARRVFLHDAFNEIFDCFDNTPLDRANFERNLDFKPIAN